MENKEAKNFEQMSEASADLFDDIKECANPVIARQMYCNGYINGMKKQQSAFIKHIEEFADEMYNDLPVGEVSAFELIKLYNKKYNELTNLLSELSKAKQTDNEN